MRFITSFREMGPQQQHQQQQQAENNNNRQRTTTLEDLQNRLCSVMKSYRTQVHVLYERYEGELYDALLA